MAKDVLYFSHDSNAGRDPKIIAMRGVYKSEGYGWYWLLIELMRESDEYKLDMRSKYAFNAYAMHLQCDSNAFASFLNDCINEFNLFSSDGEYFWSDSLLRRMEIMNEKSEKARESAKARWRKSDNNANASNNNANASKNDAKKESKENKEKEKEEEYRTTNLHEKKISQWITQYRIKGVGVDGLDTLYSYIGQVDLEVIEKALMKSDGKHLNYACSVLNGFIEEGLTRKNQLNSKPRSGKQEVDKELEYRNREIAFNRWIEGGNDPHEFVYKSASGN